ncbi:MAG: PACE efflux transporter [Zoogloea sp.]|nr:PACE efflux transporter [Zoogloea sp.]
MFVLRPRLRRIVYCIVFETIATALSGPMLWTIGGGDPLASWTLAAVVSVVALTWNYVFNTQFEAWERRHRVPQRSLRMRWAHAGLFEGGLIAATVPLYMVWYDVGLWKALQMEAAILAFFFLYTFAFTWLFDRFFVS